MMKYLLLICDDRTDETAPNPDDMSPDDLDPTSWIEEMQRRGVHEMGERLRPPSDATTIRVRDGETVVSDGPFAETKEHIAGFDVIDCADLDEAIEVASKHPVARFGMIEVRPFWPL